MSKFYDEQFIEDIKGRINNGEFESKEVLAQYLKNIPEMVANNSEMLRRLESYGIEHNVEDLNELTTIILDYYDKSKIDKTSINADNVTSLKVSDKEDIKVENPAKQIFENMDDYELEFTLNSRFDSLTAEQKEILKSVVEKRKQAQKQQLIQRGPETLEVQPKVKVLTMKDLNKKYNGFTSIVFICLLTIMYGAFCILYILLSNGMLK